MVAAVNAVAVVEKTGVVAMVEIANLRRSKTTKRRRQHRHPLQAKLHPRKPLNNRLKNLLKNLLNNQLKSLLKSLLKKQHRLKTSHLKRRRAKPVLSAKSVADVVVAAGMSAMTVEAATPKIVADAIMDAIAARFAKSTTRFATATCLPF